MTKPLTVALLATCCLGASPISLCHAAQPAVTTAASTVTHVSLLCDMVAALSEMTTVLDSVKDKASADAVAPKVVAISAKIKSIGAAGEALGEPSKEMAAALEAGKPALEDALAKLMTKLMPVAMNGFYGSTALQKALESVE